ncbi:unnamed protein product [Linum trigynum]|uniref:Uncharacterized protein n=1 Tax=Linum trigynum TaxID=586398 RepID=A0AAV2EBD2_9ROSI
MRRKCRIWWPKQLSNEPFSNNCFLFGWVVSCSSVSVDVVVAFGCSKVPLSNCQSGIQGIIDDTNGRMPMSLQEKSRFCLLGHCTTPLNINGEGLKVGSKVDGEIGSSSDIPVAGKRRLTVSHPAKESVCECNQLDGFIQQHWKNGVEGGHWIHLMHKPHEQFGRDVNWVPQLHHVHWNGQVVVQCDVHVILYEIPVYGKQHLAMNFWRSFKQVEAPLRKPQWLDELRTFQPELDMDALILAMNSTSAAGMVLGRYIGANGSCTSYHIMSMCLGLVWQALALFLALLSTIMYIILQLIRNLSWSGFGRWICTRSAKLAPTMSKNVRIRCSQMIYWPIFLEDNSIRSRACVEYAEKAALHRHSMWTGLLVDLLFGNLIGLVLFSHAESVCLWVSLFAKGTTNEILRSGCVWLMGVPAGFKLNTELAGILGMVSLNAIQIWSTLWVFIGFLIIYFIKGLALLGILFGLTIPAALAIDIVGLATAHVSVLHSGVSILYSSQIEALGAIWRLFRGRKKNPLRKRLDSYDYTVKQHVVGSLLFTPLLLLLPTTSVFYIFFTILKMGITTICTMIDVAILMIHGTPYLEIFLWLSRRGRFPCGVWFEITPCSSDSQGFSSPNEVDSRSKQGEDMRTSSLIVSVLHSNYLSIGDLVLPHYREVFSGVSRFLTASSYGALTGKRTHSRLDSKLPSILPWVSMPSRDYWLLCYNSVMQCSPEHWRMQR